MSSQALKVEKRKIFGRKVKVLRKDGILPANIYGKKVKSEAIQLKTVDFAKVFGQAGETGIVELLMAGKKRPVLIHGVQTDPVSDDIIHADFLQVNLKEKVTVQVPVELVGEASAEKEEGGTIVQHLDEIEVEALPNDLPDKFEINLAQLKEIDAFIKVSDLNVDNKKVKVNNDPEQIIVKAEPPRKEEEEVQPPATEEEGEVVEEEVVEGEDKVEKEAEAGKGEDKVEKEKSEPEKT